MGGGGRYDDHRWMLGGKFTAAIGFATGIERIVLNLKNQNVAIPAPVKPALFIACMGEAARIEAMKIAASLRDAAIPVIVSPVIAASKPSYGRPIRSASGNAAIIGDDEVKAGTIMLRNMQNGEQQEIKPEELKKLLGLIVGIKDPFPLDTFEAIHGRRSVRQYKETPVPDDLLKKVLEAARWAPSWANSQCTRYVIVKDPATKEKLAETLNRGNPSTEAIKHARIVVVACAERKKAVITRALYQQIGVIGLCLMWALPWKTLRWPLQASGLGTVHVGFIPDFKKVDEDIRDFPEGVVSVEMTPLGFPAAESKAPPRKELAEIVFYEKYGKH